MRIKNIKIKKRTKINNKWIKKIILKTYYKIFRNIKIN